MKNWKSKRTHEIRGFLPLRVIFATLLLINSHATAQQQQEVNEERPSIISSFSRIGGRITTISCVVESTRHDSFMYLYCPQLKSNYCAQNCRIERSLEPFVRCREMRALNDVSQSREKRLEYVYSFQDDYPIQRQNGSWFCEFRSLRSTIIKINGRSTTNARFIRTAKSSKRFGVTNINAPTFAKNKRTNHPKHRFTLSKTIISRIQTSPTLLNQPNVTLFQRTSDASSPILDFFRRHPSVMVTMISLTAVSFLLNLVCLVRCVLIRIYIDALKRSFRSGNNKSSVWPKRAAVFRCCLCNRDLHHIAKWMRIIPVTSAPHNLVAKEIWPPSHDDLSHHSHRSHPSQSSTTNHSALLRSSGGMTSPPASGSRSRIFASSCQQHQQQAPDPSNDSVLSLSNKSSVVRTPYKWNELTPHHPINAPMNHTNRGVTLPAGRGKGGETEETGAPLMQCSIYDDVAPSMHHLASVTHNCSQASAAQAKMMIHSKPLHAPEHHYQQHGPPFHPLITATPKKSVSPLAASASMIGQPPPSLNLTRYHHHQHPGYHAGQHHSQLQQRFVRLPFLSSSSDIPAASPHPPPSQSQLDRAGSQQLRNSSHQPYNQHNYQHQQQQHTQSYQERSPGILLQLASRNNGASTATGSDWPPPNTHLYVNVQHHQQHDGQQLASPLAECPTWHHAF